MMYDPAFRLHTVKQAQQEHRDIASAHRLARTADTPTRAPGLVRRLPRLRRRAVTPVGLQHNLTTS